MFRSSKLLIILAAAVFLLTSCSLISQYLPSGSSSSQASQPEPSSSSEVIDTTEYPVELEGIHIPEQPVGVVSLSPAITEMLGDLGYDGALTGVSDFCDVPASVTGLPKAGTAQLPDMEVLTQLKPQVVFASAELGAQEVQALQALGAQVVVLKRSNTVDGIQASYVTLGIVMEGKETGKAKAERAFEEQVTSRLMELTARVQAAGTASKLKGIYLRIADQQMATGDTLEGEFLKQLGLENLAEDYTNWLFPQDKLVDLYPDVMFVDSSVDLEKLAKNQVYNTTDALKKERCYVVDGLAFERQSFRMIDELEKMAQELYGVEPPSA